MRLWFWRLWFEEPAQKPRPKVDEEGRRQLAEAKKRLPTTDVNDAFERFEEMVSLDPSNGRSP